MCTYTAICRTAEAVPTSKRDRRAEAAPATDADGMTAAGWRLAASGKHAGQYYRRAA